MPHSAATQAVKEVDELNNHIKNLKNLGNILYSYLANLPEDKMHEQMKWDLKYWVELCNKR